MTLIVAWVWAGALAAWFFFWGMHGDLSRTAALLHWPVVAVLLAGFVFHIRGGLIAGCVAVAVAVALRIGGVFDSWTVVAWQALVYWVFGLYPFKFMQIREQRQYHYRTLLEYKRGEIDGLKGKLADVEALCARIERRVRNVGRDQ